MTIKAKKWKGGNPPSGWIRKTVYLDLELIERWRIVSRDRGETMTEVLHQALKHWIKA